MQNLKLYTKAEVMKMALEIEAEMTETILENIDTPTEGLKLLLTANRFKSAIYERLELSKEEFDKISNEVIKEREKGKHDKD